jgi:excinuclease ABC subunit B
LRTILEDIAEKDYPELPQVAEEGAEWRTPDQLRQEIARLKAEMLQAACELDFEKAAELRDRMLVLEKQELQLRDG